MGTQVASRKWKLQDRWGVEESAKGHRFKLSRDMVGYHHTRRAAVEHEIQDPVWIWVFALRLSICLALPICYFGSSVSRSGFCPAAQKLRLMTGNATDDFFLAPFFRHCRR